MDYLKILTVNRLKKRKWATAVCGILLSLIWVPTASGQKPLPDMTVRNITMNDGLPTNSVRSIAQDKYGFIWFGTDNGLCRYDGYGVQTFVNPQQGIDQYVSALGTTEDGMLVGTNNGAYLFSFRTEKFTKLSDAISVQVTNFTTDGDKNIWISTINKGVYRYNEHTHECQNFPFVQWHGEVSLVFVDTNNQVWALSNRQESTPYRLNKATNRFVPFAVKSDLKSLRGLSMLQGNENDLLIGTWEKGLVRMTADGTIEQLINPVLSNVGHHIHTLFRSSPTEIYVGSDDGLILYNLQTHTWQLLTDEKNTQQSIAERFIYSIIKDGEGGVWIGTYYGGVSYFSPIGSRFHAYRSGGSNALQGNVVGRFAEDEAHRIWIATDDGGLNCYEPTKDRFLDYPGKQVLSKYNVHALWVDGKDLWVGTYSNGVVKLNTQTGAMQSYQLDGRASLSNCYCLFRDSKKRLWATSMDGINLFDNKRGLFQQVKNIHSLTIDIYEDRRGGLWFATQGEGAWRVDAKGTWKQYKENDKDTTSIAGTQVNCVRESASGRLFLATDKGLCEYLPKTDSFKRFHFTVPSNDISSIVFNQDEMWLSTTKGIIKHVPGEKVQVYNRFDGLTCDQFQPNAGFMASDGRIYFGTTRGFNAFYPYQIKVNQVAPPVFITSIELFNEHVEVGSDKLPEALNHVDQVDLSYDDNMVSINFAALSYISPEKNQYAYMLEGFDKDWIYTGSDHKAVYTNLPAGDYTFRVKATNNDGVWSENEARLKIEVHPPFWWSWPAKLFYLFLVGYLVYLYTQMKVKREERRHQREIKQLSEKKEQEVRDARLQFFTMIAHEIRTPVTLIIGPLESLKTDWEKMNIQTKGAHAMTSTLEVIDRNAHRLLTLVNQLLDFNKVQQRGMQVHFRLQNISKMMHAVAERFEPTLQQNGATLKVEYPADDFAAVIDNEAITKVISNLMTNATKYTKDYVCLRCKVVDKEHFCIEVEDNGIGISADEQGKIFKAFYQAKDNKPGTGIGLNIVKNLVEAHHGMVEVESQEGQGSTFIVTLPIHQQDAVLGEEPVEAKQMVSDADKLETEEKQTETAHGTEEAKSKLPTMLVVDDDEDMRNFIVSYFQDTYHVFTAENGVEALRELKYHRISLIVSDWMMPEMDGAEFCRQVRANQDTSHIPFVMLTAKTDDNSKTESMNCGADAFIEKPFSMKYLDACIRNMLEMRQRLQNKYSHSPFESVSVLAETATDADNEFLEALNKLIEDNMASPDLNVAFLAEQIGISRSSLFSKLKALVNMTPNEMIQVVKLKRSAHLLLEGRYRVSEVGYMVGFSSPSYFTKCFVRQFGVKPGEFVEQYRQGEIG